ncbi:CdiI family contact-dependent growth inhibition immunity protein [Photorhabdus temperata]|uniref:contact-dependent growth inhibition system immunity protein n=1 Tax=Photorhabdus temperata TaxID=574560 RepID=UPI0021D4BBF8|nr:contact-dependent growth inhibition system immunity protein [Photorhabdus temperata]MCT8350099.1 CdiI family contact-dependent growth inhibition immunity protein [Photorhabdus temperata]
MSEIFKRWKNARCVFNGDFYSVTAYSGYRALNLDTSRGNYMLTSDVSDEKLGIVILDALSKSRLIDPDDNFFDNEKKAERYKGWVKLLMETYNYRSKRQLFKKMHNCGIQLLDGQITIRPSCHEKLEGWSGDGISESDYVVIPANSSPEEIGAALRLAFSRCRSYV